MHPTYWPSLFQCLIQRARRVCLLFLRSEHGVGGLPLTREAWLLGKRREGHDRQQVVHWPQQQPTILLSDKHATLPQETTHTTIYKWATN